MKFKYYTQQYTYFAFEFLYQLIYANFLINCLLFLYGSRYTYNNMQTNAHIEFINNAGVELFFQLMAFRKTNYYINVQME